MCSRSRRPSLVSSIAVVATGLALCLPAADAQQTLSCGQVANGALEAASDADVFEIDGSAGDVVWLSIETTLRLDLGFEARVDLYRPDEGFHTTTRAAVVSVLPATGRYALRVSDGSTPAHLRRGAYQLRIAWLGPAHKVCGADSISCGVPVAGEVLRVDQDLYQFDGAAGDVLWLSVRHVSGREDAGFSPRAEVRLPNGNWHTSVIGAAVVRLPVNGTYLLRVFDGSTTTQTRRGSYGLMMEWLGPSGKVCGGRPLPCTQPIVDTLVQQGLPSQRGTLDQDLYWFDASAGDRIDLSVRRTTESDESFTPRLEVYGPDARWLTTTLSTISVTAPVTGRYTIRVWDFWPSASQFGGYYSLGFGKTGRCNPAEPEARLVRFIYLVPAQLQENPEYTRRIRDRALHFRNWLQQETGGTFNLPEDVVTVTHSGRTDSYFAGDGAPGNEWWVRVYSDALLEAGVRMDDPGTVWVVYVDSEPACRQLGGSALPGVAIMPRHDLQGREDECGNNLSHYDEGRWIGGLGHELLHALGLLHPPGCDINTANPCDEQALMWEGYGAYPRISTYLRPDEKIRLRSSPFMRWADNR